MKRRPRAHFDFMERKCDMAQRCGDVGRKRGGTRGGDRGDTPVGLTRILPGQCWYPTDQVPLHIRFKTRQVAGHASTRYHVPYGSGPCLSAEIGSDAATWSMAPDLALLAEVGSDAATCPMAPNLTSRLRWALVLPRVLWLQISPPG
jgi:hypothetical protein